jgi:hypothetical protein
MGAVVCWFSSRFTFLFSFSFFFPCSEELPFLSHESFRLPPLGGFFFPTTILSLFELDLHWTKQNQNIWLGLWLGIETGVGIQR